MSITLTDSQFSALSKTEQQGFGSYAIFGEQSDFYNDPDVWVKDGDTLRVVYRRGASSFSTAASGGGWDGEIYTPPTGWSETVPGSGGTDLFAGLAVLDSAGGTPDYSTLIDIGDDTADFPSDASKIEYIYNDVSAGTAPTGGTWDGITYAPPSGWSLDADSLAGATNPKVAVAILGSGNSDSNITYSSAVEVASKHVYTDQLCPTVFEFVSSSIVNESTQIIPERISPTAAAIKNQDGMVQVSGDFNMHLHVAGMLLFWKYILMDPNPTGVRATATPVPALGTLTGTLSASNRQLSLASGRVLVNNADPYPKRLTVTLGGTIGDVSQITFKGTDQNDRVLEETVNTPAINTAYTTRNYFKSLVPNGITANGSTGAPSVAVTLHTDHQQRITFSNRDALLHGLTAEINKGDTPNVYTGLQISSASLTFAENIDIALTVMGYRGYLRQNLLGDSFALTGTAPEPTVDFTRIDETGYDFKRLAEDTYKSWGSAVRVYDNVDSANANSHIIPVTDVTLNVNHNLEYPVRYWGQRFQRKPTRTAKREVTVDCTTDFTLEDDYAGRFFDNRVYDNADLLLVYTPYGGAYYETLIKLGRVQFTTYTDPEVSDQGPLLQTLNLKSLPSSSGRSDELGVEIVTPETLADNRVLTSQTQLNLAPSARA